MKIQVLGSGCPTCQKLYGITQKAVSEMGLKEKVEYLSGTEGMQALIEIGSMSSPVLAVDEKIALERLFAPINAALKQNRCQRAVLVGHNAWFDLLFIKQAVLRTGLKSPFHDFTCFDTATLGGLVYGQTVLAKAAKSAGVSFNTDEAHSAIYDAQKTAELFCTIVNAWDERHLTGRAQGST